MLVVGSAEEYGKITPEDLPVDEETPLRPVTPYGVSKVAQDYLGLQYYLSYGVAAVRVRSFNHIGPRQREGFVAADFAKQIAEIEAGCRPPQVVVGDLSAGRDFSDVRDVASAYHLALTRGEPGEVYNIGSGNSLSRHRAVGYTDPAVGQAGRHRAGPGPPAAGRGAEGHGRYQQIPGAYRLGAGHPVRAEHGGCVGLLA